jgi:hypothetical protein
MANAVSPVPNPSDEKSWPVTTLSRSPHLESLSQKASNFVSGRRGSLALLAVLTVWIVAIPFVGWSRAYQTFDQFVNSIADLDSRESAGPSVGASS